MLVRMQDSQCIDTLYWAFRMVQSLWQPVWSFLKKIANRIAISLLGIYPKELKSGSQRDNCTPMFTVVHKGQDMEITERFTEG